MLEDSKIYKNYPRFRFIKKGEPDFLCVVWIFYSSNGAFGGFGGGGRWSFELMSDVVVGFSQYRRRLLLNEAGGGGGAIFNCILHCSVWRREIVLAATRRARLRFPLMTIRWKLQSTPRTTIFSLASNDGPVNHQWWKVEFTVLNFGLVFLKQKGKETCFRSHYSIPTN